MQIVGISVGITILPSQIGTVTTHALPLTHVTDTVHVSVEVVTQVEAVILGSTNTVETTHAGWAVTTEVVAVELNVKVTATLKGRHQCRSMYGFL